jgi:hypothetical protein
MIIEITTVRFLALGVSILSRLIGRRRDVLFQNQIRAGKIERLGSGFGKRRPLGGAAHALAKEMRALDG